MKKTFVKTVVYTLCLIASAVLIVIALFSMFAPGRMANLSYKLGDKRTCVWYTQKEYEKNGSINTLDKLLYRVKWLGNNKLIVKYSKEMIESGDFDDFCKKKDAESDLADAGGYRDYICGDYVVALYDTGEKEQAMDFASDVIVGESEYGEYNVYRSLLYHVAEERDTETLKTMIDKLGGFIAPGVLKDDTLALEDKQLFTDLLNKLTGETNE